MSRQTASQWSKFWESGSLTSFIGRFENNYEGDVLAFWHLELRKFPTGATIVDLATGNGALAFLAAQYGDANMKNFSITAVDYADIKPEQHVANDKINVPTSSVRFLPATNIEDTGLETGSFDCAISQFGFEYGEPASTAREASRILKPEGAKLIVMMHHQESAIIRQAHDGVGQVQVCEQSGLHPMIRELVERLETIREKGDDPASDSETERLRQQLNTLTGQLHEACDNFRDPSMLPYYLKNSMAIFNPQVAGGKPVSEKIDMLRQIREETEDYKQRMEDLVSAAHSDTTIATLERFLANEGFVVDRSEPFFFEGIRFCHCLVASR